MEFERLPRESSKAFDAFRVYLDLGPERSLALAAQKLGKSKRMMEKWSKRFDWSGRVDAYDTHLAVVTRDAEEAAARTKAAEWATRQDDQREREWKIRCQLLDVATEALRRWNEDPKRCGTLEGISRIVMLGTKLGRLASGMPADHTETKTDTGPTLDPEWELAIKKIYGSDADNETARLEKAKPVQLIDLPAPDQPANAEPRPS